MRHRVLEEVKRIMNPEFINRIDELVVFNYLNKDAMIKIVDLVIDEMLEKVSDRQIDINLDKRSKEFIADKGFDPVSGARPLKRTIQKYIEDPIAEEILKGNFTDGSIISVKKRKDKLVFTESGKKIEKIDSDKDSKKTK